jgi:integrase
MSAALETTFGTLAREWWQKFLAPHAAPKYAAQVWRGLERDALPALGNLPLPGIDPPLILSILRRVEARGTIATAHKLQSYISQVLRYGIACGLTYANPARDLGGAAGSTTSAAQGGADRTRPGRTADEGH